MSKAASTRGVPERWRPWTPGLLLVVLLALAVRLAIPSGAFGSDDVTYFERATQLTRGIWSSADYNGALRYGYNIPAAVLLWLFGTKLFVASLWPLICSVLEVAVVYLFASAAMNRRAGVWAALLLALAPLHVGVATRIHADSVVSIFVTTAFALIYLGLQRRSRGLFFAAGLCIGGIFWAKELAAVTWFAYLPLLWFFRGRWRDALLVVAGTALMMLLHGLLMQAIAGDPLHLVRTVTSAVKKNFVDAGEGEDAASYYLRYLFFDIRHVSLMAFIAAFAVWRLRQRPPALKPSRQVVYFTALWWVSLLLVLSLFPVSLSPLRLAMKQSNYITLFMAPMAILAGMGLATLPRLWAAVVGGLSLALGLLLSLLQQADWYAFTANSRAVAAFTLAHPRSLVVGSANNGGMGKLWAESTHPGAPRAKLISFRELQATPDSADLQRGDFDARYTVLDRQTMNWFAGPRPITQPLPCWSNPVRIEPVGLAAGNHVAAALSRSAGWAADAGLKPAGAARDALARLARPQPADIYQVTGPDVLCGPS